MLTSDSTRIVGLVSLADVANGKLRMVATDDPRDVLERLEGRIDRNDSHPASADHPPRRHRRPRRARGPASRAEGLSRRARCEPLARGLVACCAARRGRTLCAARARLSRPAGRVPRRPRARPRSSCPVALSARPRPDASTASPTCSRRCSSCRRSSVRLASVVSESGSRRSRSFSSAATGSGPTAAVSWCLLAGYARARPAPPRDPLHVARRGLPGRRIVVLLGLALVGLDAALGASSHVTHTLGDGPLGVLQAIGDRLELSLRRAFSGWGPALVVIGGLAGLAVDRDPPPSAVP